MDNKRDSYDLEGVIKLHEENLKNAIKITQKYGNDETKVRCRKQLADHIKYLTECYNNLK